MRTIKIITDALAAQLPRFAPAEHGPIPAILTQDGVLRHIAFRPKNGLTQRQSFAYERENGFVFSFPKGAEGVYVANEAPQMDARVFSLHASLEGYEGTNASITLVYRFVDARGRTLQEYILPVPTRAAAPVLTPPTGSTGTVLELHIKGDGMFRRLDFVAESLGAPRAPNNAERIQTCIHARNYEAGIALYNAITEPDDLARKQAIRCHAALHEFEDVIAEFEKLDAKLAQLPSLRLSYIRALANLGHIEKTREYIAATCLDFKDTPKEFEFLLYAYPFSTYISAAFADMVLGRILAYAGEWNKKHLNHLLRCAHELANAGRFAEFFNTVDRIEGIGLITGAEKAKTDILKAQVAYVTSSPREMTEKINQAMARHGAYPLALPPHGAMPDFKDFRCPNNAPRAVRGPLVSVLMTSFNSEKTIEYALRSVMEQTYADLEIIVIDDLSTDGSRDVVARLMQEDTRITLVALDKNGGTYVAKNHGLARARGEFVTCQDSDDWAHPEKIETMVEALEDNPALTAVAVQHIRYDPARGLRGLGGYIRPDVSSLTYRREAVVSRIGYYDSVRAGADSEFQFRIERAFGKAAIKQLPNLLSLVLWSEKSLSGGGRFAIDDDCGIFTPFRNDYRTAFFRWQESATDLRVPFPLESRHFAVPEEGLPES